MPSRFVLHVLAPLFVLLTVTAAGAQIFTPRPLSAAPVTARAVISAEPLLPGTDAEIVVELTINPRYHVQSAFAHGDYQTAAARLKISALPPGLSADPVQAQKGLDIPTPAALGTGTLSVYEGHAYFLVPLKVAPNAPAGPATLGLLLTTYACTDTACDPPVDTPLSIPITIAAPGTTQKQTEPALFTAAHAQQFALQPLPAMKPATTNAAPAVAPTSAGKQVTLLSPAEQLSLIASRPYIPANSADHAYSLPIILLFALLGGLLLNIMPCVLPVIPLKALSFIQQAHGNPRLARLHGLAFSGGIITLFIALAIILRLFNLFYGQQFQSPAFLIIMAMFVVALALSMLGVWTIQPPRAVYAADEALARGAGESTLLGSFSSGLMATLLATPCSAPFLGPVLAWALVQPAALTAAILALVGLGMALPYLFLAYFPQALSKIPRAGRWSELLKQALGIIMLAVAIYLVTLVPSTHLWPWILAGAVVLALVCWAWGQIPTPLMSQARIWTIRAIALAIGILLSLGIYKIAAITAPTTTIMSQSGTAILPDTTESADTWLPFNLALLDQALKDGRPVLVDWTADWCINCRVLEATVLKNADLHNTIIMQNALLLRADLSQDNPPAGALNQKLGSRSIPVLAIFRPSAPTTPTVLRDTYSASRVIQELRP